MQTKPLTTDLEEAYLRDLKLDRIAENLQNASERLTALIAQLNAPVTAEN